MAQDAQSQATGLQFTLTVEGLDPTTFAVVAFKGEEGLSTPFAFDIELASVQENISPEQIIDCIVQLAVWQDGEKQQQWQGIASQFSIKDSGFHHTFYSMTIVPPFFRTSLRHNSRIFQQHTVPEIISVLLKELGISNYLFALKNSYQPREYCVQYRETDLAFIDRIAAEEGLFYYFSHTDNKNTVIFSDDSHNQATLAIPVPYNAMLGGTPPSTYIKKFERHNRIAPTTAVLKDYSFKNPAYAFLNTAQGADIDYQRQYEHYDYPGRYKSDACGRPFSQFRIESLRREAITATGRSNHPPLLSGIKFILSGHPEKPCNRDWLLVQISHTGTQPQALEQAGGTGVTSYNNKFTAIPAHRQWRPAQNPKPRVDGPQIATVVGPEGEEIYCDAYGRVKVQFPWDRYSNNDDTASCWIRVAQGWAGSQFGMVAIPRVDHEVIVSFLEGDPDQPIITGRTYHASNPLPYPLPANKTRTVLRTATHQGEGYNEIRFEDQAGEEEIFIHAQKDSTLYVGNDQRHVIGNDMRQEIHNNQIDHIKANHHLTVDGESRQHTKGDMTLMVDASLHTKQAKSILADCGDEVHLKAGNKMVLDAGSEITLKVGGSFVKVAPSGVTVVGPRIGFNSGGSAGSGSGYAGNAPELPKELEPEKAPKVPELTDIKASKESGVALVKSQQLGAPNELEPAPPIFIESLLAANEANLPILPVCGLKKDGSCSRGEECLCNDK